MVNDVSLVLKNGVLRLMLMVVEIGEQLLDICV